MTIKQMILGVALTFSVSSAVAADFAIQCRLTERFTDGMIATTTANGVLTNVSVGYEPNYADKKIQFILKPGVLGVAVGISTNVIPSVGPLKRFLVGTYQIGNRIAGQEVVEKGTTTASKLLPLSKLDGLSGTIKDRIVIYNPQGDYCTPTNGGYGECPPVYPGLGNPAGELIEPKVISELSTTCEIRAM